MDQNAADKNSRFGPFTVLELLGAGRTAEVFRVRREDSIFALKKIKAHLKYDNEAVSAIVQESEILSAIKDPKHFPLLYEAGEIEGFHYLLTEYVHGLNLKDTIHRGTFYRNKLSLEESCWIAAEICQGLDYLHQMKDSEGQAVLHKDVKSANILVSTRGEVKLIDLSLKHGTFKYLPLERLENRSSGPYSDIFATGHVLYEMLHGRPLIKSESELDGYFEMKQMRVDDNFFDSTLPLPIRKILTRSLGQNSESRFASIGEFKKELLGFLGSNHRQVQAYDLGKKIEDLKRLPKLHSILPIGRLQKIDSEGFLVNDSSMSKIRPPWTEAVEAIKKIYLKHLPGRIHSLYLRGSVPVGRAIQDISDIDSMAVVDGNPKDLDLSWVGPAQTELKNRFPFCPYVEFDFIPLANLMADIGYFSRRFAIKVLSTCVYGEDLAVKIPKFKPKLEIAFYFHGNIEQVVEQAIQRIQSSSQPDQVKVHCTWVMKRLLRTGFGLTIEKAKLFTRDLYPCYEIFSKFYPEQEPQMRQALEWAINPSADKNELLDFLNLFGRWLSAEAKKKFSELNRPS